LAQVSGAKSIVETNLSEKPPSRTFYRPLVANYIIAELIAASVEKPEVIRLVSGISEKIRTRLDQGDVATRDILATNLKSLFLRFCDIAISREVKNFKFFKDRT
jgi:hypothetical protein